MNGEELFLYEVFESSEVGASKLYGIRGKLVIEGETIQEAFLDAVFRSREEALSFAHMLTENRVYPCHMEDIAEDVL